MSAKDVGRRIHVYWADEMAWFTGTVDAFDPGQGLYVVYDDGDERWEGPNESYRFEGNEDQEHEDGNDAQHEGDADQEREEEATSGATNAAVNLHTPYATDPPPSDEDESDVEAATTTPINVQQVSSLHYPRPVVLHASSDSESDRHEETEANDEDAQSVALTDIPTTYEPANATMQRELTSERWPPQRRALPHRGLLRGVVVRASDLPLVNRRDPPTAYIRVAFAEGAKGDEAGRRSGSLLLRCKQTLASTRIAPVSCHPQWNDGDEWQQATEGDADGLFQLHVAPPCILSAGISSPAWQQLRGELIFSVYHQPSDDLRNGEFIGQATVSLARVMCDLLSRDDEHQPLTRMLPLETRQGRPVGTSMTQLVVQFQCELEYPPAQRQPRVTETRPVQQQPALPRSSSSASTRPGSGRATTSVKPPTAQPKGRPTSSSEINRRKLAKQIESENRAMAKRLAEHQQAVGAAALRRQRLLQYTPVSKSEPKEPAASRRGGHKASSQINRAKFVDQVKRENAAMGKRLLERSGRAGALPSGSKENCDDLLDWDDATAQDKAYVTDKRRVLRSEKDYLMEKAQASYQQQNELVEDVMQLQQHVADAKAKLFQLTTAIQRLDAMNKRDAHVRDCLQRAATKFQRVQQESTQHTSHSYSDDDGDGGDSDDDQDPSERTTYRKQWRELRGEMKTLDSERQRLTNQLHEANQRVATLEDEVLDGHRKWQFVQNKRAFQAKMTAASATPVSALYAGTAMQQKKYQLELSVEAEEQYAIHKAQQELTQLQIALTVLKDKQATSSTGETSSLRTTVSSKACEYLRAKIAKRQQQIEQQEREQHEWRAKYEALVVDAKYERLRARVLELQHLMFLCESEAKHVAAAERVAIHRQHKTASELQRQRYHEQTESDILLKHKSA